ncbi:hypothetical protein EYF80_002256 [Liparis tanakae]|uniref:Uncharacterized protein n=1 Tax=Liparis tanakae TaxID=230148 RepID=A0A4Z2JBE1_9TELE|nr:hypothetical protein EYF80_002256 [Liparis tanakae]
MTQKIRHTSVLYLREADCERHWFCTRNGAFEEGCVLTLGVASPCAAIHTEFQGNQPGTRCSGSNANKT